MYWKDFASFYGLLCTLCFAQVISSDLQKERELIDLKEVIEIHLGVNDNDPSTINIVLPNRFDIMIFIGLQKYSFPVCFI